jgi:hypothetical protein
MDEYKGYNGTLILTSDGVIIKRGAKGYMLGGGMLRGDKTIPYSSIVAVQLKKAGMTAGYLQLTLSGGSEAKSGLFQSIKDENTVNFHATKNNLFQKAKEVIESKIMRTNNYNATSQADEIEKLAALKEKGIITVEEFDAKKKKLLESMKYTK